MPWRRRWSRRTPDSDGRLVHDPKPARDLFGIEQADYARERPQHVRLILECKAENDDPGVRAGRVRADIGEVGIQRHHRTLLALADLHDERVRPSAVSLVIDRGGL